MVLLVIQQVAFALVSTAKAVRLRPHGEMSLTSPRWCEFKHMLVVQSKTRRAIGQSVKLINSHGQEMQIANRKSPDSESLQRRVSKVRLDKGACKFVA